MWGWFWIIGIVLAVAGVYLFAPRRPKPLLPESLYLVTFDDRSIEVADPAGKVRRVAWEQITRVGIRTTDEGPLLPDEFWGIHAGGDEPVVMFPGGATGESELLAELQQKLPGFNNDEMAAAMGSTSNAYFLLWQKSP